MIMATPVPMIVLGQLHVNSYYRPWPFCLVFFFRCRHQKYFVSFRVRYEDHEKTLELMKAGVNMFVKFFTKEKRIRGSSWSMFRAAGIFGELASHRGAGSIILNSARKVQPSAVRYFPKHFNSSKHQDMSRPADNNIRKRNNTMADGTTSSSPSPSENPIDASCTRDSCSAVAPPSAGGKKKLWTQLTIAPNFWDPNRKPNRKPNLEFHVRGSGQTQL